LTSFRNSRRYGPTTNAEFGSESALSVSYTQVNAGEP
jgi:hypothetical protein